MVKVLVILPFYGGSLPIGRFAAEALTELGYKVEVFESPSFYNAYTAIEGMSITESQASSLQNSFLDFISQAIMAQVLQFNPDLVLSMAQAPVSLATLQSLRKNKYCTAMWFVEDHMLFPYWQGFAPNYDVFAVIQKEPFLSKLHHINQQNALYLPLAAQPSVHKKLLLSPAEQEEYGSLLSFLGAGYLNRQTLFKKLLGFDLKIWGTGWEDALDLMPLVQREGARISSEDAVKIYNATAINLNLHSSIQADAVGSGDFVNPRTFELACTQAFQLVDTRSLMPELFAPDELVTFSSIDELIKLIIKYANAPEQRQAIALKAHQRVLAEHTYKHRMQTLLQFVAERIPHFGQKKAYTSLPDNTPETLRKQYATLMDSFGLPASASFTDVINLIKSKEGVLTEIETAIIYLDEWRKQYL